MRITEHSQMQMVIKHEVDFYSIILGLGLFLAGSVAFALGMLNASDATAPRWAGWLAAAVLTSMIFMLAARMEYRFEKGNNKIIVLEKKVYATNRKEYALSDVCRVGLREERTSKGGHYYIIGLKLADGSNVDLRRGRTVTTISIPFYDSNPEIKIAPKIAEFLGVPYDEMRTPTVQEALSAFREGIESASLKFKKEQDAKNQANTGDST